MAKPKYDGVVEVVHYKPNGEIDWVRAYERRGPTFSDHLLIGRQTLIERIKAGKKFVAGKRVNLMASTFEISSSIQVVKNGDKEVITTGKASSGQDHLEGVPIF